MKKIMSLIVFSILMVSSVSFAVLGSEDKTGLGVSIDAEADTDVVRVDTRADAEVRSETQTRDEREREREAQRDRERPHTRPDNRADRTVSIAASVNAQTRTHQYLEYNRGENHLLLRTLDDERVRVSLNNNQEGTVRYQDQSFRIALRDVGNQSKVLYIDANANGEFDTRVAQRGYFVLGAHTQAEAREQTRGEASTDRERAMYEREDDIRDRMMMTREKVQENRERAMENRARAQERFNQAQERQEGARERVVEARTIIRSCEEGAADEERCVEARSQIRANAQPFLSGNAEIILRALYKQHERIEASDIENKEVVLARIEAAIANAEKAYERAQDVGEDQERIREANAELRLVWDESRDEMARSAGIMANQKVRQAYNQIVSIRDRLDASADRLEEQGHNISSVGELFVGLDTHLARAKTNHEWAQEVYLTAPDRATAMQEANEYLQDARSELVQARDLLREIMVELKEIEPTVSFEAAAQSEVQV